MMDQFWLGIDQGSSSTKALLLDHHGHEIWTDSAAVRVHHDDGVSVQQDPEEIFQSVRQLFDASIAFLKKRPLGGVGLACQRSGVCAWEAATGRPLSPLFTHRDRSASRFLPSDPDAVALIAAATSLPLIPNYAGPKIAALQEKFPLPEVAIGTLDSYLLARACTPKVFITDDTMAARTLLYSLQSHGWDKSLCALFKVQKRRLALCHASAQAHGSMWGVPLYGLIGDAQSSLIARLQSPRQAVLNLGTIASIALSTTKLETVPGFVSSILFSEQQKGAPRRFHYLLEGVTSGCGALLSAARQQADFPQSFQEIDTVCKSSYANANAPVAYCPYQGSSTPHWRDDVPMVIERGIEQASVSDRARALVEAIGCAISEQITLLENFGLLAEKEIIAVSGGVSAINHLLQFIADITGHPLQRYPSAESSARGAAMCAMLGAAAIATPDLLNHGGAAETIMPQTSIARDRFARWNTLMKMTLQGKSKPEERFHL